MNPKGFGFHIFRCALANTDPRNPPPNTTGGSAEAFAAWFLDFGFACRAARLGVK